MLLKERVETGAVVMAYMLFDPPPETKLQAMSVDDKYTILNMISSTGQWQLLTVLSEYLQAEKNPALIVITAVLIRRLGLPQQPRPGRDPTLPAPPITADSIRDGSSTRYFHRVVARSWCVTTICHTLPAMP